VDARNRYIAGLAAAALGLVLLVLGLFMSPWRDVTSTGETTSLFETRDFYFGPGYGGDPLAPAVELYLDVGAVAVFIGMVAVTLVAAAGFGRPFGMDRRVALTFWILTAFLWHAYTMQEIDGRVVEIVSGPKVAVGGFLLILCCILILPGARATRQEAEATAPSG
jgi:hypothetical protein